MVMEHGYRFKPLSALLFMIMFFLCISNIIAGVLVDKVSDAGSSTCNPSGEYNAISTYNHNKPDQGFLDGSFVFKPEDITLSDDGFHGSDSLFYTEWWYFDATLNSNYSIQMIINAFGLFNSNLVLVKLNLYRYGDLIISREKVYLSRFFSASSDEPRVLLDGEEAMRGYIADGVWVYNVNISIDDVSVSLVYTGVNKGWKGAVLVGDWVVALPKAYVSGEVVVDDTVIHVEGVGYHDHNYDLNWRMFLVFGWYWGKIHTSNYTLTWSYQMKDTRLDKAPLLVINQGAEDYISIDWVHRVHYAQLYSTLWLPYTW